MTRLRARISSLERAAERQHHTLSLPALFTHSPETSGLDPTPLENPPLAPPTPAQPTRPLSPAQTLTFPSPAAHTDPPVPNQTRAWSSIDSSLDPPPSLKATLREVLCEQPWEESSPSLSSLQDLVDPSGQSFSAVDATATSDCSFNPLTYKVDTAGDATLDPEASKNEEGATEWSRESVCTTPISEKQREEMEVDTLTGTLRFVKQTLAMQDDPFLWGSSGQSETGRRLPPQVTAEPLLDRPVAERGNKKSPAHNGALLFRNNSQEMLFFVHSGDGLSARCRCKQL